MVLCPADFWGDWRALSYALVNAAEREFIRKEGGDVGASPPFLYNPSLENLIPVLGWTCTAIF